jgi:type IV pilus assembly protein PilC
MPLFQYQGKNLAGAIVSGELRAKNQGELEKILKQHKIILTSFSKKTSKISLNLNRRKIKKVNITRFTRQFATMIGAGLPMVQCLDILGQQSDSAGLKRMILDIKESVQSGTTLAEALSKHKKVFDELYINMVDAGEVSGSLEAILLRLAIYREKADTLIRKVKAALIYPMLILVVAIGITIIMLTYIVPIFANLFTGLGSELPGPTKLVLSLSNFLRANLIPGIILLSLLVLGFRFYFRTEKGKLIIDKIWLKFPLIGNLLRKTAISRFTRTLGTLISSGVAIIDALGITAKTSGNKVIQKSIEESALSIAQGESITQPLTKTGVFPPMVTQMISVGEKTGKLDDMVNKIADFYEEEVEASVTGLTSILEPVIILVMGIIVGGILIAMYLPMFEIIGKIG